MKKISKYTHVIYNSIGNIAVLEWEHILQKKNIYLSIPYLEALEKTANQDISFFYVVSYMEKEPVIISAFQLVTFEYIKNCDSVAFLKHFTSKISDHGNLAMNMLVCGNVFATGENGFIASAALNNDEVVNELPLIAKKIKRENLRSKELSVILFKEFWPDSSAWSDKIKDHNYKDFMIDVNMVLPIHEGWKTMKDYLESIKAKYRTRANSVYKKSKDVKIISFSSEEIMAYKKQILVLYNNVLEKSDYRFGNIDPSTFSAFKKNLGDSFVFRAALVEDTLVGFSTSFFHHNTMEANYVGIDYVNNLELTIYQRLLYDYVEQAITHNVKELQLGRTSELIKSALGAQPVNMKLYARHKRAVTHLLMSSILSFVSPSKFELRAPFKAAFKKPN